MDKLPAKVCDDVGSYIDEHEKNARLLPQIEMPVRNLIFGGVYVREILIPKGTLATGAAYKKDHISIMVYGDMNILLANGTETRISGYHVIPCKAGTRKMGLAHEDSLWLSILPTELDEVDDVLMEYIDQSLTDLSSILGKNIQQIGG